MIDRIKSIIQHYHLTVNSFAKEIGSSQSTISQQLDGKRGVSLETVQKIINSFELISSDWLLTGRGQMLKDKGDLVKEKAHPLKGIPLVPLSAMAGSFTCDTQVLECECEKYVVPAFRGADFLIHVKGDSMYPNYKSGDIVACKRVTMDDLFFQWNHIYVLDTDQGPLIKRIRRTDKEGIVSVVSDNPDYEPFELSMKHIYHVALVIGMIRLE